MTAKLTNALFDIYLKKGYAENKKEIAELRIKRIKLMKNHAKKQTKQQTNETE